MKEVQLSFGKVRINGPSVIVEVDSGVDFGKDSVDEFIKLINQELGKEPYGYISHRLHDYSTNPAQARRIIRETNVVVAAFVLKRRMSHQSFETESLFYNIPKKVFNDLPNAEAWVETKINKNTIRFPQEP